jgi:3-oxoadipate enol-lactonase
VTVTVTARRAAGEAGISYGDRGDGSETVLFIPGLGMREATWGMHAEVISRGRRALTMDPRGSGDSDTPDSAYTSATVVADVAAVLDDAGVDAVHVVGQSMGGMIAQDFALACPDRVRSLTLVSTYARADEWSRGIMLARRRMIDAGGLELQFAISIHLVFSPRSFRDHRAFIASLQERLAASPPVLHAYLRQIDYVLQHDATPRLHEIGRPTLVVAGGHDVLTSAIQNRELADAIPGARYEEFADASHGLIWEEPERFADVLTAFLDDVSDDPRSEEKLT